MLPKEYIPKVIRCTGINGETFEIKDEKLIFELANLMECCGFISIDVVHERIGKAIDALQYTNRTTGLDYKSFSRLFDAIVGIGSGGWQPAEINLEEIGISMEK